MPLSWNQIRANAAKFSEEWKSAKYEKGETQTFYNEFFEVFGHRRRSVAVYEHKVKLLKEHPDKNVREKTGYIDLFWPNMLVIEQKSLGRNLRTAKAQAMDYIQALKEYERPRYLLLSDFQNFELYDFEENQERVFRLEELKDNARLFGFIAGYQQQKYRDQDPVNIEAANLMGNMHRLLAENGYRGHDLQLLLVRIMFCLFADDTGIFSPDSFLRFVEDLTKDDGSDLGPRLIELFQVLDTSTGKRQKNINEILADFPYVNGQLFKERIETPAFNQGMRQALLQCCNFHWAKVSPALFGSLFQTVMLPERQRAQGAHYTSEKNILKTIHPLFLDDLYEEFENIKQDRGTQRSGKLKKFHDKLASMTFFDPACGCGNFLILAYRELRELELKVLKERFPKWADEQHYRMEGMLNINQLSRIDVDQFYGIELEEFPARIAEAAMWLVDHQMNMKLSEQFGEAYARLPLQKAAHIEVTNALRIDWAGVLPPEKCNFILGNPPFIGKAYREEEQQQDMRLVFGELKGASDLDYVACWYMKAAQYIQNKPCHVAFVSTNSITQGEQVALLWKPLMETYGIKLHFAHRTFKWTIDTDKAEGMRIASVYVVIIGFGCTGVNDKKLFDYDTVKSEPHLISVKNLNPYLVDSPNIFIKNRTAPLCDIPEMSFGSMPNDGGNLLLKDADKKKLLSEYPQAEKFIRPLLSADEFLYNQPKWCLWLKDISPDQYKNIPPIMQRVAAVKELRQRSTRAQTKELAKYPYLFGEIRQPSKSYLAIPKTSSERREYIPMAFLDSVVIANTELFTIPEAGLYHLGVLQSSMHMAWVRIVCGRLESRYRYSNTVVYNNFPWPNIDEKHRADIEIKAQAVLDAREQFPQLSLAELYDPDTMQQVLRKAHEALDKAVDKAYRTAAFNNERERIEFLFNRYLELTEPLTAGHAIQQAKPTRTRRKT